MLLSGISSKFFFPPFRQHTWSILLMVIYVRVHQNEINASYALTVNTCKQLFLPKRSYHKLPANQATVA